MTVLQSDPQLPLTPAPGSTDDAPLVSPQQYANVTKDNASDSDDITEALADAITMVCQECNRTLAYGEYTEVKYLYENGMVFPSAVPIDPTKEITSSEVIYNPLTDDAPGSIIQGWGVWVGWFTPMPWMPVFAGVLDPQTQITYTGGFKQSTLPPRLRRLICRIAYRLLHPNNMAGLPGGDIKSVSVNGVSVSGEITAFDWKDNGIANELLAYTRPDVEAWQT